METMERRTAWKYEEDSGAATPQAVVQLMEQYGSRFGLLAEPLLITTSRRVFGRWLGRRIPSAYGGAYVHLSHSNTHAILINLERIDHRRSKSLEIVIAEELMHMRDWLDNDRRRHARHGHDRIALRVARVTGATLDEVRGALIPVQPRGYRYVYTCPNCGRSMMRKRTGHWACRPCWEQFGKKYLLHVTENLDANEPSPGDVQ
jgi:predicted SprT family Zn-dependent metalloprotease